MIVNFLFSSITFISYYVPLVIECNKRNINCRFIYRKNLKKYADPYVHEITCNLIIDKYNIIKGDVKDLVNDKSISETNKGIIICVDGDIYGPHEYNYKESILLKIDRSKYMIYSITENMNFKWSYPRYKTLIDYLILTDKQCETQYSLNSTNNLYLGNSKFDNNFDRQTIINKYRLDDNNKYVLIYYPRFERGTKKYGKQFVQFYTNLYTYFHELGYKIIVKNREKLGLKELKYSGDYYFQDLTLYPYTSLELIYISSLCVFFGSAVIEEVVMFEKPFIEVVLDDVDRFAYLRNDKYMYLIDKSLPTKDELLENINRITEISNNDVFKDMKNRYMSKCVNSSSNMLDAMLSTK